MVGAEATTGRFVAAQLSIQLQSDSRLHIHNAAAAHASRAASDVHARRTILPWQAGQPKATGCKGTLRTTGSTAYLACYSSAAATEVQQCSCYSG